MKKKTKKEENIARWDLSSLFLAMPLVAGLVTITFAVLWFLRFVPLLFFLSFFFQIVTTRVFFSLRD